MYIPLTLLQGFEKGYSRFACERDLETEHKLKYFDPTLMAVSMVSFSFSRAAQLEAQGPLCWVMTFFIASYQHLLWTPTHQGPNGPFGLMWLSLPHLVLLRPISLELELNWPLTSVFTELYNSSMPTRSLKSNV